MLDIRQGRKLPVSARQTGVTLIELVVVLTIISILAAIAVPNFNSLMVRKDMENTRETIVHTLKMAKQMAQAENTLVDVVIGDNQLQITQRNNAATKTTGISSRVKVATQDAQQGITLTFWPTGIVTSQVNGQVIDLEDNGLALTISPSSNGDDDGEVIMIGTYGTVGGVAGL